MKSWIRSFLLALTVFYLVSLACGNEDAICEFLRRIVHTYRKVLCIIMEVLGVLFMTMFFQMATGPLSDKPLK